MIRKLYITNTKFSKATENISVVCSCFECLDWLLVIQTLYFDLIFFNTADVACVVVGIESIHQEGAHFLEDCGCFCDKVAEIQIYRSCYQMLY